MCRQSVHLLTALIMILMGIVPKAIQSISSDSSSNSDLIIIPGGNEEVHHCINFTDHYCNQLENRSTAYFPNLRGHKTVAEANDEFQDFIQLLQSGCDPKLGTLLCFIYFPFCESSYPRSLIMSNYLQCEVCQEVYNSKCMTLVDQYTILKDHLQCNMSSTQCADDFAQLLPPIGIDECADGTHDCDENADCTNTDSSYTCTCQSGYSGDGRTCTVCGNERCPYIYECNYRSNANLRTFERNAYCYAAQVTVTSNKQQGCHHAYIVEVNRQFNLQTPFNSSHSTKAPSMGESAVILTSPAHCTKCPNLEANTTYLIAGAYSREADGSVQWKLEGVDDKSLVSDWVSKYDRKIDQFVSDGNSERKSEMKFLKECERNNEYVLADQWILH